MRRHAWLALVLLVCTITLALANSPAWAVAAFSRRYGVTCSTCHTVWPALNSTGYYFKLSGYRRLNGIDLKPTTQDINLAMGALSIPAIPPLAVNLSTGFDYQTIDRKAADGSRASQTGSSLDLQNATIFLATPLGDHLSTFLEFPMFETMAPDDNIVPTGPSGANATDVMSRRDITFDTESPVFETGKLTWNTLLPFLPADSLNLKIGVDQLPTGFSADMNRFSVRPYLMFRRRALDLISPAAAEDVLSSSNEADRLNRLGENQLMVSVTGLLAPFGDIKDLRKPTTVAIDYEFGLTNGTNVNSDSNTEKDVFGRVAVWWYRQRLGFFGYWSPDIYDDNIRADAAIGTGTNDALVMSGRQVANRMYALGPDLWLTLEPWGIPVWLETEVLFNRESNPTGFNRSFSWWSGFTQLNGRLPVGAKLLRSITGYARYEMLDGDRFDDIPNGGVTGIVRPHERQVVAGAQWLILENLRVVTEYSRHWFENNLPVATLDTAPDVIAGHQRLTDNFFTVRVAIGF